MMLGTIDYQGTFRPRRKQRDPLTEKPRKKRDSEDPAQNSGGEPESMGESMESGTMGAEEDSREDLPRETAILLRLLGRGYRPSVNLTHRMQSIKDKGDKRIVNALLHDLLAIEPPAETRARVLDYFRGERQASGGEEGSFLEDASVSEPILRRVAHLILSLPEAQLN